MSIDTLEFTCGRLTRIGYLDLPVPSGLLGLTPEQVVGVPWSAPRWAAGDQPLLGLGAWFADLGGRRVAIDPLQTLDVVLRPDRDAERQHQDAVERLFAQAGFAVGTVDLVVLTHIDGVGMAARRDDAGRWVPFFPNARILLSDVELAGLRGQCAVERPADLVSEAWAALLEAGCVGSYRDGEAVVPGLVAQVSGGHGRGHAVLQIREGERTVFSFIGHLAVSAVHLATGECGALNEDPAEAWRLLHEVAQGEGLLAGSLWPTPGYGRWDGERLRSGDLQPGA